MSDAEVLIIGAGISGIGAAFHLQRDHPALINQCLRLLRPDGVLYFSTNNRRFRLYDEHIATDRIRDITRTTTGFDFEGKLQRLCFELRPAEDAAGSVAAAVWKRS